MRLLSCILCLMMLCSFLILPASAVGSTEFIVRTDKEILLPGDTITCTVSMGAVDNLFGMKLKVTIPEGLTVVEDSGIVGEDLATVLHAAKIEFVETTGVFLVGACEFTSTMETMLFQFQCTVDEDATGSMEIFLDIDPENVFNIDYENIGYTVTTATVKMDEECKHSWKDADPDENGHWYDCELCDLSKIEAHVDDNDNKLCDVCGYNVTESEDADGLPSNEKNNGGLVWAVILAFLILGCAAVVVYLKKKRKVKRS